MNIQNWIKSEYVTIGNALLSFVWRVSPSDKEGKPPGSLVSHVFILSSYCKAFNQILTGSPFLFLENLRGWVGGGSPGNTPPTQGLRSVRPVLSVRLPSTAGTHTRITQNHALFYILSQDCHKKHIKKPRSADFTSIPRLYISSIFSWQPAFYSLLHPALRSYAPWFTQASYSFSFCDASGFRYFGTWIFTST